MKESLPLWVRDLLAELYHPLGKRRLEEASKPFARALEDLLLLLRQWGAARP